MVFVEINKISVDKSGNNWQVEAVENNYVVGQYKAKTLDEAFTASNSLTNWLNPNDIFIWNLETDNEAKWVWTRS